MTLEEQIKHYRKQAGLSQEKMAEKIGVSRQAITKWENGTGTPDIANLMAIADLFQISVDELLSNEKSEKKQSNYIYESRTEYDIDGKKNFDIKLGGAYAVDLKAYHGEKIEVAMFSNVYKNLLADYKVKIDDIKTESILILTDLMKPVKQMQRRVWSLLFYSGKIYWKNRIIS